MYVRNPFDGPPADPFGKVGIFLAACRRQEDQLRLKNGSQELASVPVLFTPYTCNINLYVF